jgi:hypothetical protein
MFTNGVVASVKIYRGDDGDAPRTGAARPARGPDAVSRAGAPHGADSRSGRDAHGVDSRSGRDASASGTARGGVVDVAACGPAPQEGSKT